MSNKYRLVTLIAGIVLCLSLGGLRPAPAQQPREQGPAPATCEQAHRENAAYRERIASLERQIDATNEEAKTFYLRAEDLREAYQSAIRLADLHRNEAAELRYDLRDARDELRELRRATRRRRPRR